MEPHSPELEYPKDTDTLTHRGEVATFTGEDLLGTKNSIKLAMGSKGADGKTIELRYEMRQIHLPSTPNHPSGVTKDVPTWRILGFEDTHAGPIYVFDASPHIIGRTDRALFKEGEHGAVSGNHLMIITGGPTVSIVQQGRNQTDLEFPTMAKRKIVKLNPS